MTPRLLTERDMADYLSLPIAAVRRLPVGRVTLAGRVRFDRQLVDRWLDGTLDATPARASGVANENLSEADADLASFIANRTHAPRRP